MSRHLTHLISLYHDLRDRYGSDDAMVIELKMEVDTCEFVGDMIPSVERRERNVDPKFWNRKPVQESAF